MDLAIFDIIIFAFDRLALAVLLAASLAGIWLSAHPSEHGIVVHSHRRTIDLSIIILIVTTLLILLLRTASLADVPLLETMPYVQKVVEKSQYGVTWLGRIFALGTIILLWLIIRQRQLQIGYGLIAVAVAATAFFISSASHAGEDGLWAFENFNNSLHIIGGALWGGSVLIYALFIRQLNQQNKLISDIANHLSFIATIALATVILTGLLNAWFRLEAISDLWTSDYGITLIIKLLFVFIMMNVGALNRFIIIPRLIKHESAEKQHTSNPQPAALFSKALYFDSVIFSVIIILAVTLATVSPPGH